MYILISVGYHSKLHVAITFYQHYHFLPTTLYHIFGLYTNYTKYDI